MKVIVTGGRDFNNKALVWSTLDKLHQEHVLAEVVHGGARGADSAAEEWAVTNNMSSQIYYPDWDALGKAAGPIRNRHMLNAGADLVVAFPGGRGTADMVSAAKRKGFTVLEVKEDGADE